MIPIDFQFELYIRLMWPIKKVAKALSPLICSFLSLTEQPIMLWGNHKKSFIRLMLSFISVTLAAHQISVAWVSGALRGSFWWLTITTSTTSGWTWDLCQSVLEHSTAESQKITRQPSYERQNFMNIYGFQLSIDKCFTLSQNRNEGTTTYAFLTFANIMSWKISFIFMGFLKLFCATSKWLLWWLQLEHETFASWSGSVLQQKVRK